MNGLRFYTKRISKYLLFIFTLSLITKVNKILSVNVLISLQNSGNYIKEGKALSRSLGCILIK